VTSFRNTIQIKFIFCLLLAVSLFPSCRTITRTSDDLGIAPSTVIFSFDDGPNSIDDTTARVLDVLKKYEIRALFSLLGVNVEANPDLVRRIYDEGHYIINHGYANKWVRVMGRDEFLNNLVMGEAAISAALGKEFYPKLYRPHGGFYSPWQEEICRREGYTIASSSIRVYDAILTGADRDKTVKRIIGEIEKKNGGVILLHDARGSHSHTKKELKRKPNGSFNRSWIPDALEETIIALQEKGYKLNDSPEAIFK